MEGHQPWVKYKQSLVYPYTTPGCYSPRTDAGSNGVESIWGFIIKYHHTANFMPCPILLSLWDPLLKRGLRFVRWRRTRNPVKEQDPIVHGQMELPNTNLQAIDLNPNCSKQVHFNRLGIGHGYESTVLGCILTILHVSSVIRPLGDTRLACNVE